MNPHTGTPPHRWAVWLSTGFGAGYLPRMPGTYGSVEGVLVFLGLHGLLRNFGLGPPGMALAIAALCLASVWITSLALPHFASSDPQAIVIDEIAGQALTLAAVLFWPAEVSWAWYHVLAGFILFRAFDITKPLMIRRLEKLPGAWGVVGDDLGAGLLGGLVLLIWGYAIR